jgi:glutathione S-transferase
LQKLKSDGISKNRPGLQNIALAIAEYLHEIKSGAGLFPSDQAQRAHCRSICGEMHSGFSNLRSALPMNIKARFPGFKAWAGARADIDRITTIWQECLRDERRRSKKGIGRRQAGNVS